ncbi:MAG: hypothetical protein JWM57_3558 [Phycisphaerales bacterium]|nr:hypothetical protein [Phycisphaerales bacterium]
MSETGRFSLARIFGQQRHSTPRRPGEALKTLGIVVPLTMLIWVYAEKAQSRPESVNGLKIAFSTGNGNFAATVEPDDSVTLSLEGPQGQLDQFKQAVAKSTKDGHLVLALPNAQAAASTKLQSIADAVKADPQFVNINVTVKASPPDLRVSVDPVITRKVTVAPPPKLQVTLQNVAFDPPQIDITGPLPMVNSQFGGDNPTIAVDGSGLNLGTTSGAKTMMVPLKVPQDSQLSLSRSQVKMTYEVGSTIQQGQIRTVYIDVRRPVGEDGRSKVIVRDGPVIHNIQVTGPSNVVNGLIGDTPLRSVKAVLSIVKEDVDAGELRRTVEVDLRDGVTLINDPPEVVFEVRSVNGDASR